MISVGDLPPEGDPEFESFISNYDQGAFGPKGDPWAKRSITISNNMSDTYYLNHYMNEQVTECTHMVTYCMYDERLVIHSSKRYCVYDIN